MCFITYIAQRSTAQTTGKKVDNNNKKNLFNDLRAKGNRPLLSRTRKLVDSRLYSTQQSIYDLMLLTKSFLHLLLLKLVSEECDQHERIVCLVHVHV